MAGVAEWQAAVLLALVAATTRSFRTRNGLEVLRSKGWLDPRFSEISDEIASAVREDGTPFNSPIRTVEAYLRQLEQLGALHCGRTELWQASNMLRMRVKEARDLRQRPQNAGARSATLSPECSPAFHRKRQSPSRSINGAPRACRAVIIHRAKLPTSATNDGDRCSTG